MNIKHIEPYVCVLKLETNFVPQTRQETFSEVMENKYKHQHARVEWCIPGRNPLIIARP